MTDFVEYLTAKRTVDDRALNRRVWDAFVAHLTRVADEHDRPLRIVEVGAGVGSMLARLAAWEGVPGSVSYRAVDLDESVVAAARERVPRWLADAGYAVDGPATNDAATPADDQGFALTATPSTGDTRFEATFEVADAAAIADEADAVVAGAFLDVVDLDRMLPALRGLLRAGGVLYAPCTFDGATGFAPDHPDDDRIERLYHRHMDEVRDLPGSSRAGRDLLERLPDHGYSIAAVGGADWIARPEGDTYPHDEKAFLDHLLATIDGALADYPADVLDPSVREEWVADRRAQLDAGSLTLVAHHLDVLARADPTDDA